MDNNPENLSISMSFWPPFPEPNEPGGTIDLNWSATGATTTLTSNQHDFPNNGIVSSTGSRVIDIGLETTLIMTTTNGGIGRYEWMAVNVTWPTPPPLPTNEGTMLDVGPGRASNAATMNVLATRNGVPGVLITGHAAASNYPTALHRRWHDNEVNRHHNANTTPLAMAQINTLFTENIDCAWAELNSNTNPIARSAGIDNDISSEYVHPIQGMILEHDGWMSRKRGFRDWMSGAVAQINIDRHFVMPGAGYVWVINTIGSNYYTMGGDSGGPVYATLSGINHPVGITVGSMNQNDLNTVHHPTWFSYSCTVHDAVRVLGIELVGTSDSPPAPPVDPPPTPPGNLRINHFAADPPVSPGPGEQIRLFWDAHGYTSLNLTFGLQTVSVSGLTEAFHTPLSSTTYTLTARNGGDTAIETVDVAVQGTPPPPPPPVDPPLPPSDGVSFTMQFGPYDTDSVAAGSSVNGSTIGFVGRRNGQDGFFITGHHPNISPAGSTVNRHPEDPPGMGQRSSGVSDLNMRYSDGIDAAWVRITNNTRHSSRLSHVGVNVSNSYVHPIVGSVVHQNGRTSRSQGIFKIMHGEITVTNTNANIGGVITLNVFRARYFSQGGDSGGPVVSIIDGIARPIGIHAGSNWGQNVNNPTATGIANTVHDAVTTAGVQLVGFEDGIVNPTPLQRPNNHVFGLSILRSPADHLIVAPGSSVLLNWFAQGYQTLNLTQGGQSIDVRGLRMYTLTVNETGSAVITAIREGVQRTMSVLIIVDSTLPPVDPPTPPVDPPTPPPGNLRINHFTADPPVSTNPGDEVRLFWDVEGYTSLRLIWGQQSIDVSWLTQVFHNPTSSIVYTLEATDGVNTVSESINFVVQGTPAPPSELPYLNWIEAHPNPISPGATSTISWSTNNVTSINIDNGIGLVIGNYVHVNPIVTTTYTIQFGNEYGQVTTSITIWVQEDTPPPPPGENFSLVITKISAEILPEPLFQLPFSEVEIL